MVRPGRGPSDDERSRLRRTPLELARQFVGQGSRDRLTRRPRESPAERRESRGAVDDPAVVLQAAARFLEARSRSVAEVRRRLTGAGYRADLVEGAIERMTEVGMLDDEAFARAWVESRDRARPRGERAIREELRLKGVDRASIDLVLEERREAVDPAGLDQSEGNGNGPGSADELAADRLLERHRRSLERVADPRQRRGRAYALLARNGFDPEVCRSASGAFIDSTARGNEVMDDSEA
jgi:regulatory protein